MRTMSACCLTVYAKSPGFAIVARLRVTNGVSGENSGCMWKRCAKPGDKRGGYLAIQDHYHPSLDGDPQSEVINEVKTTFAAVWEGWAEIREPGSGFPGTSSRPGLTHPMAPTWPGIC